MKTKLEIIPGPFRVCEEEHDNGTLIIRSDPKGDGDVPGDLVVALICGGGPEPYARNTAELLAAAPKLYAALERQTNAVAALGKLKEGKTLFELSPTKDAECFAAWLELDAAGKQARSALSVP